MQLPASSYMHNCRRRYRADIYHLYSSAETGRFIGVCVCVNKGVLVSL